jgi:hypothetical protein
MYLVIAPLRNYYVSIFCRMRAENSLPATWAGLFRSSQHPYTVTVVESLTETCADGSDALMSRELAPISGV